MTARGRGGAMAASYGDGAWGPMRRYPKISEHGEVVGFWVHRDQVHWHARKEREWHFLPQCDYNHLFPRDQGKGCSKNKDKSKHLRPAPYAGPGKRGKPSEPHLPAWPKGGASSSTPRPPAPPSRSQAYWQKN
eukprot:3164109-Pyramimonas_sp.AAC.1